MEAMTQQIMLHRRPHAEIWSAREGSDDDTRRSTSATNLWRIPNNVNKEQRVHFRNQTLSHTHISNHGPSQIPQNWAKYHNHMTTTELHLRNQPLTELNLNTPHVHLVSDAASVTNGWQHPTTSEHQNKTWTKHRCSSLDPITHPIRNRRLRQILTARILRRRKSRRRNGKP